MLADDTASSALAFLIGFLAAYRIARVVTQDSISLDFRRALRRWAWRDDDGDPPVGDWVSAWRSYVYVLLTCPLCLGVWVAALVYVAWVNWSWSHPPLVVMAIAGAQCFLATREGPE